ncbi:Reverse transcriptase domain-containing protein [Plasmodiophora brassicae]
MRFAFKQIAWSEQIKDDDSVPFLVRVLRWALNNPHSRFNTMLKGCNVYADATAIYKNSPDAREQRAREELADAEAGRPSRKRPRLPDRQDALLQALELHTWTAADASCKLMRLQLQPYNLPFPAAYHSGDDAYAVASWVTNRIPGSNAQCRACNDKNLSRYHIAARCTESSRLLRPIIDWRIRALHFNRADTGVAIDYVAIQLNDYARLTAPPAREDGRLRPRRMPDPRDPTFRLSDRQRRWLAVLGKFIRAVAARCVRGEPLLISARGVAALAGLDATLWDEISDEEDNENARVAVQAAESVLDDPELAEFLGGVDRADPGDDADVRARQRARQLSPTAIMTAIVMRCIANAIGRPAEADAGPQHEARVLLRPDAPSPASSSGRVQSPLDGHSAAVLERRARSWRPPSTLRTPPILSFASSLSFSCSSCRVPDALAVF